MPTENQFDFTLEGGSLYREDVFTDLRAGSIRRMAPVLSNGDPDTSRAPVYTGTLQLMSPQGPLPIQSRLPANNLEEAIAAFPDTMKAAVSEVVKEIEKAAREAEKEKDSRIIVPGKA